MKAGLLFWEICKECPEGAIIFARLLDLADWYYGFNQFDFALISEGKYENLSKIIKKGIQVYQSNKKLQEYTGLSKYLVNKGLNYLIKNEYITKQRQYNMSNKEYLPNVYLITSKIFEVQYKKIEQGINKIVSKNNNNFSEVGKNLPRVGKKFTQGLVKTRPQDCIHNKDCRHNKYNTNEQFLEKNCSGIVENVDNLKNAKKFNAFLYFINAYKRFYNKDYISSNKQKDARLCKLLCKKLGEVQYRKAVDYYFDWFSDDFAKNNGYNVVAFNTKLNAILQKIGDVNNETL